LGLSRTRLPRAGLWSSRRSASRTPQARSVVLTRATVAAGRAVVGDGWGEAVGSGGCAVAVGSSASIAAGGTVGAGKGVRVLAGRAVGGRGVWPAGVGLASGAHPLTRGARTTAPPTIMSCRQNSRRFIGRHCGIGGYEVFPWCQDKGKRAFAPVSFVMF